MKPLEIYDVYKSKLDYVRRQSFNLNLVAARTSVNGLTSIDTLAEMVDKAVEAVKCEVAFLKDPFGETTLDNYHTQMFDTGSQMQVFEHDIEDNEFDARAIFDAEKLNKCVDDIYRALTLWQFSLVKKMDIPSPLVKMDLCVSAIIDGLYKAVFKSASPVTEGLTLSGATPNTERPLIEFRTLEKQIFFTQEEREDMAKAEAERKRAMEEAATKAKLEEIAAPYKAIVMKHFPDSRYDKIATNASVVAVCPALLYIFTTLNKSMQLTVEGNDFESVVIDALKNIDRYNCWQFVIGKLDITYQQMAWINKFFEWILPLNKQTTLKKDYHVFGMDDDFENLEKLKEDDLIDLVVAQ